MPELNKREMQTYGYGLISTPFQSATQETDQRIGHFLKIAQYWRKVTFASLALTLSLFIFFFLALIEPQITLLTAGIFPNGFVKSVGALPLTAPSFHKLEGELPLSSSQAPSEEKRSSEQPKISAPANPIRAQEMDS